jgi:hypothetical protein
MTMSDNSNTAGKGPVSKLRVGNVTANIWRRATEKKTFYSVTLERGYKDAQDKRQSTSSLDAVDIQNARKALDLAHDRIRILEGETSGSCNAGLPASTHMCRHSSCNQCTSIPGATCLASVIGRMVEPWGTVLL